MSFPVGSKRAKTHRNNYLITSRIFSRKFHDCSILGLFKETLTWVRFEPTISGTPTEQFMHIYVGSLPILSISLFSQFPLLFFLTRLYYDLGLNKENWLEWTQTFDLLINMSVLNQLSYVGGLPSCQNLFFLRGAL